jgi:hypothetical protein
VSEAIKSALSMRDHLRSTGAFGSTQPPG